MHEVQPQKMHGPRFVALFAVDKDRNCWRCAVTSVLGSGYRYEQIGDVDDVQVFLALAPDRTR